MSTETLRLLPSERQQRIRQLAAERGVLRVSDLAQTFEVSEMTIRRDLASLEAAGQLERTFGGAVAIDHAEHETNYQIRMRTHTAQKDLIAACAAGLVQAGDTIALDASTSALALARRLSGHKITVVTNSLDVAQVLRGAAPKVICTGGWYRETAGSFVGPVALRTLSGLRVDQLFFSAKGVLVPDGFVDSDLDEIEVKRAMLGSAAKGIALVDSSKFGKRALGCIATFAEVDVLVTDGRAPQALREHLREVALNLGLVEVADCGAA